MDHASPKQPWASAATAQRTLSYTQVASPIILLFVYLIAFTAFSILTASNTNSRPEKEVLG